jgi:hypothetical protein
MSIKPAWQSRATLERSVISEAMSAPTIKSLFETRVVIRGEMAPRVNE